MAVDREKVLQSAQKLIEKKRYDKAILELQRIVAEDPKDARTLLKIGDCHINLEQYAEAVTTYERVGQFYSMQGFALKAIAVYKQIREIINKHAPNLQDRFGHIVPRLAEIYTQLGLTSDALAAYDEVATRLQRLGRDRDAIDIFRKVVDLDPQNPLPYLRLAEAFVRVKDLENAVQRFGAAAEILLRLERREDALKVVERLLQYRADAAFARMAAEIYLERGQPNDGMAALTKLQISFKENPKDLETLALLARAFDKLNQGPKAIEVQKEAARIAREAGKLDAFNSLVESLLSRAPNDDGVKQLAALRQSARPTPPPVVGPASYDPRASIDVEVDDVEEVLLEDDDAEAPFVLRPSQHSIPPQVAALKAPIPAAQMSARAPARPAVPAPEPADPAARARLLLTRADNFRRAQEHEQAVALLRGGIVDLPGARELREKLCDLLIEMGDQDGAVREMLAFAHHQSGAGDVEGAARLLDEILLLEPGQPEAVRMLGDLGYAVPSEAYAEVAPDAPSRTASGSYDPNAPLPSYDLEEVGAAEVLSRATPIGASGDGPAAQHRPVATSQLDDPFAGEAPLPSFPMDEEATQFMAVPSFVDRRSAAPPAPPPPPAPAEPAQLDEDALEEVEFFTQHGMFDEARGILSEQLSRLPNHPLLLERQREIEAMASAASSPADSRSGAREVPRAASEPGAAIDEDRSFDIAASLDALDALDALEAPAGAGPVDEQQQISVESVFEQFKAGVAAQIPSSDASTHYDLGVAYQEMALLTDAIHEFALAARDPERECVCQAQIGMIHLQLGDVEAAVDAFLRGLQASQKTVEQELQLTYEIGNAYEVRRQTDQALYYFQRVARINPEYNDMRGAVSARIARLQPAPKAAAQPKAVGADLMSDEFDAAFDDLLSRGGKLP